MNFSTLRDVYVAEALRSLGHGIPNFKHSDLPALTNRHVLSRLNTLPDVILRVKDLQATQEHFKPTSHVDQELKVFCQSAGRRLVRACAILEELRGLLNSGNLNSAFLHHKDLVECLLQIRESLAFWEESIGAPEFYRRHVRCQEVRFQYLKHTLCLVSVIVGLTFPEGLRAYVLELEDALGRPHLPQQFFFDSPITYAWTKKRTRVGLTAPLNRTPKRFIPSGLKKLSPFWYRNPNLYGHLLLANERCIRQRKAKLLSSWMGPEESAKPPTQATTPAQAPPQPTQPTPPPQTTLQKVHIEPARTTDEQFRRSAKQLGMFFAGAGFLVLSTMITRRAVARKIADSTPRLFQPSHLGPRPPPRLHEEKSQDQAIAAEALGLATLNVFSFGIMLTGGLMWAFDLSNVEDLRTKARAKLYGANGVVDEAAEQQIEEWIADVLSRKDKKENEEGTSPKKDG
ncbi:Altered inheritance of mitochondria protein 11 [Cytospora mali]|uniref:Altered inheritance of mitochondria protein 11 n=1 Tax=Cytospora mali TaxID=578113 RepID=A0A194VDF3_CYTMA|nr:Altered inheritance of mitochondria protein 11 [Valsa mali var. pyri (nom. inval.)]